MFTIKNAVKNIYRYKSKYILFGILFFIMILSSSICLRIFLHMSKITDNMLKEYCSIVRFDQHIGDNRFNKNEYLKLKYENIEYVEDLIFYKYSFASNILKEDVSELEVETHTAAGVRSLEYLLYNPVFILGYDISMLHLAVNEFKLEKGRMFETDGECVIDKWNSADINDKIIIKNNDGVYKEYTVVGIQNEYINGKMIYTTFESAEYFDSIASDMRSFYEIKDKDKSGTYTPTENNPKEEILLGYDVLIYLDSYKNFENLQGEMLKKSNGAYTISPMFSNYYILRNLIQNTQLINIIFIILISFIIIVVTIISTVILLSSRKYEIAVLRSAGMKKSRLIINYLIENFTFIWGISFIALIIAQFITPLFTGAVFTNMQDLMSVESFENLTQGFNISLIFQNIGIIFGGTTAVVMLSLILACINIIRFEPLKIFNRQY